MEKIDIKDKEGNVRVSYECDHNTAKKTLEYALKLGFKNFYRISLRNMDLSGIDLSGANLAQSRFYNCNFKNAKLNNADMSASDIDSCDFSNADLSDVDMSYVTLDNVIFKDTNLNNINLSDAHILSINEDESNCLFENAIGINDKCPKTGSFIGWKKCYAYPMGGTCLVKLEIPADALRCSYITGGCRTNKAKVIDIIGYSYPCNNSIFISEAYPFYDSKFRYIKGKMVESNNFDNKPWHNSSHGINFFMHAESAMDFILPKK